MNSLLLFVTLIVQQPIVEDSTPIRNKILVVHINRNEDSHFKGYLQTISDTALQLTLQPQPFGTPTYDNVVPYTSINTLSIHRQGNVGRGALMGMAGGALLGGIIGASTYTDCSGSSLCIINNAGTAFLAGATVGILPGLIVGIGLGAKKRRFFIGGQKSAFNKMRTILLPE